jgi:hypothetical protein
MSQWSRATVNIDYYIAFDGNLYSVPHTLVQQVWKFAPPRLRSRSFIKATGSLPAGEVKPSARMSTVPKVIRPIGNGRQVDVDFARHRIAGIGGLSKEYRMSLVIVRPQIRSC